MFKRGTQSFFFRQETIVYLFLGLLLVASIIAINRVPKPSFSPTILACGAGQSRFLDVPITCNFPEKNTQLWGPVRDLCVHASAQRSNCKRSASELYQNSVARCKEGANDACNAFLSASYACTQDTDPVCPTSQNDCTLRSEASCSVDDLIPIPLTLSYISSIPAGNGNCDFICYLSDIKPITLTATGSGTATCTKCVEQ